MASYVLLGTASGSSTLDIGVTADVPSDGSIQLVFATISSGGDGDTSSGPGTASDTRGDQVWVVSSSSRALIGLARDDNSSAAPTFDSVEVGSVGGATMAGNLQNGDTVTLTFNNVNGPGTFASEGVLLWVEASFEADTQWGESGGVSPGIVEYATGLGWQYGGASDGTALDWATDNFNGRPVPFSSGVMIMAVSSLGSPTYAASSGSFVGGSGNLGVFLTDVTGGMAIEPGVSAGSGMDVLVGNYQFMKPLVSEGSGIFSWQRF